MTALKEYARLESGGLWRPDIDVQRREMTVSFGDTTLVIADTAGRAQTHWSLAAVIRLNPGTRPALFSPDEEGGETLEIDDPLMIEAIEKVRKSIAKARPHPGRIRSLSLVITLLAIAVLAIFWLPDALLRQTQSVVPATKRAEIGATLLGHIQRVTGRTCRDPMGVQALNRLKTRTMGADAGGQIVVVPTKLAEPLYLPGGLIVLDKTMVEDHEDPAVTAGFILAAVTQQRVSDPIGLILSEAGMLTSFKLMTTGDIPSETLRAYAEVLIANPPARPNDVLLLTEFERAGIPSTPYAFGVDISGETTLSLIEADPGTSGETSEILSDADWVRLQGICGT